IEHAYAGRSPAANVQAPGCGPSLEIRDGPQFPAGPVLVTGGSGFIGSRLVARLAELGIGPIRAPGRGYRTCVELARFAVEMPRLDLLDPPAVRRVLRGIRHVFHLAYGRDGDDPRKITVDGTRNVVDAAIAEGCESVVVLSTAYVFGRP